MPASSRLARLLLVVGVLQAGLLIGWWSWNWPQSPVAAVIGSLLIVLVAPLVLAIEFVLLSWVSMRDPDVPRPRAIELLRAWCEESVRLYQVFYWRLPLRWRQPPDRLGPGLQGKRGVVFIHGFVCNRGFWAPWLEAVRERGHACVAVNLEPVFTSIDDYAPIVDVAVRQVAEATGLPPLLVCHSMGGLVARAWLRSGPHAARVAHVVTIGTPHRGTWLGRFSRMPNGSQMRIRSSWLQALQQDEQQQRQPAFTCWWGGCDNIVFPLATATLPAAENRFVAGAPHVGLAFRREVREATLLLLANSG